MSDKYSWLVDEAVGEELGKMPEQQRRAIYSDDKLYADVAKKYVAQFGAGPHDIMGKPISVGDNIAVGFASGNTSELIMGEVTKIDNMRVSVKIQRRGSYRTYTGSGIEKVITYQYTARMLVL